LNPCFGCICSIGLLCWAELTGSIRSTEDYAFSRERLILNQPQAWQGAGKYQKPRRGAGGAAVLYARRVLL
jgi:hypothetical protein